MSNCFWASCGNCPYYERETSYVVEIIRCANTDCILWKEEEEVEEGKEGGSK